MIAGFLRQLPNADRVLTSLEDAAISDHRKVTELLDRLLEGDASGMVSNAEDFCGPGDCILPEAKIELASKSRRTTISHSLSLDEASIGAPLPFAFPPVLKIDGQRIPLGPGDADRLPRAIRNAWAAAKIVSPLVAAKEV